MGSQAHILRGELRSVERWKDDAEFKGESADEKLELAHGRVFELGVDYTLLGATPGSSMRAQISLWANEIPLQVIPREGWLAINIDQELTGW